MSSTVDAGLVSRAHDSRNRAAAIHHATLIQQQKDTALQILEAQEELIDYPTSSDATPSRPSTEDLENFRRLLVPFQITDYDALLLERNISDRCGYVFCPRPYKKAGKKLGQYAILRGGKIVPQGEVRRWCSDECAKRAMFVKVQLSETPAWERQGGLGHEIEILTDDEDKVFENKLRDLNLSGNEDKLRDAMAELALERGEDKKSAKPQRVLKENVVVREDTGSAVSPQRLAVDQASSIEGYTPWMRNG